MSPARIDAARLVVVTLYIFPLVKCPAASKMDGVHLVCLPGRRASACTSST
ncbi:hypothetical protein PR003_g9088 [Phytophthora rubi]|uniref:Uncharacterized protein n=1 Tax=Phytophthora rubi TaxID=129364 RepID=A0A6A4FJ54_9STRA|nr:hypothetical protein PR002_g8746 [Phytophthora rubi]KAE9037177.1 hypothetical protein PR001_g8485 [Phytophthora rubi]KAE9343244.1 hypothetical protein PR003_g9088 [Phytophthora rubi]